MLHRRDEQISLKRILSRIEKAPVYRKFIDTELFQITTASSRLVLDQRSERSRVQQHLLARLGPLWLDRAL